jgi:hypothetical protein
MNRQLVMASPFENIAAAGGSATLTCTVSEPGQVILSNMVLDANLSTAFAGASSPGVLELLSLSSLELNGAIQYIRGRGALAAPAGAFSAYRGTNQIPLPTVHVQAGDTIAATLTTESLLAVGIDCQMAFPFIPDNVRISTPTPKGPSVYLASVLDANVAGAGGPISVATTVDESGILSLGSLQLRAYNDLDAAAGAWEDGIAGLSFSSFALPTGNNVFLGQGTVGVPGSMFAAGKRVFSWFDGGNIRVSGGDQLTLTGTNEGAKDTNISFGLRFYPDKMTNYSGCR